MSSEEVTERFKTVSTLCEANKLINFAKIIFTYCNIHNSQYSENEPYPVIIKCLPLGPDTVRFVLCINNSRNDVEQAIVKIKKIVKEIK